MTNIVASGNASVAVERDGKIRTQNILMDMSFSNLTTHFQNLGKLNEKKTQIFWLHSHSFI